MAGAARPAAIIMTAAPVRTIFFIGFIIFFGPLSDLPGAARAAC
jgi:hypothetical protein